jgi:hypothetical protein
MNSAFVSVLFITFLIAVIKMPGLYNLKEEKFILIWSMVTWFCFLAHGEEEHYGGGRELRRRLVTSWWTGSREELTSCGQEAEWRPYKTGQCKI